MIYPPRLLDNLQEFEVGALETTVYRHMINDYPPERANTRGARWNPPGVAAIYTSLKRETALAEAEYRLSLEPFRPRVRRTVYTIRLRLKSVVDLGSVDKLSGVDLRDTDLVADDYANCQRVGGAVEWLGNDGLLVPSARSEGINLVVFEAKQDIDFEFEIVNREVLADPA